MALNTMTNVMPKILAAGLLTLREIAVMPRLVNRDYGDEAAQHGATIDIPIPRPKTATDVTPSPNYVSAAPGAPGLIQVPLDQWKHSDFYLTDKEMMEIDANRHFMPMQMAESIRALANTMDVYLHKLARQAYSFVGTPGVTPFSTVRTVTDARKALNVNLAPANDRVVVLNPDAEAQALQLTAFSDVSQSADRPVKIEGELGRKFGFDFFMSQNVQTFTTGTAPATLKVKTSAAIGASALAITSGSALGTLVTGDVFTIAGQTGTYVITGATTALTSAGVSYTISPALRSGAAVNAAITKKATHVANLAFHPNAFAFATRPLMDLPADLRGGHRMMSATDPVTGLSLRLEIIRQNKQDAWDLDVLFGGKLVRPEFVVRIAG